MKKVIFEGYEISKLSFGTVQLGLNYGISNTKGKPTQKTADDIIHYLQTNDIDCFDTAVAYGNSEEVLGHALTTHDNVKLISKIKSDFFITNLEETVLKSLKNLKATKLFGLLLHDSELLPTWNSQFTEIVTSLQEKGVIDFFGISIYTSHEFDMAIENPIIKIIQIPFNLFDQRAVNDRWFEKAKKANKLIFIRSIFLQGLFFMKSVQLTGNLTEAAPYLEEINKISQELDLSVGELAMAYIDSVASDAIILFGCDTLDQAKENIYSYNNLPIISKELLQIINTRFSNVPNHIINPSQWRL